MAEKMSGHEIKSMATNLMADKPFSQKEGPDPLNADIGAGNVSHMEIEPGSNGFSVKTHFKAKPSSGNPESNKTEPMPAQALHVFGQGHPMLPHIQALHKFVSEKMKG